MLEARNRQLPLLAALLAVGYSGVAAAPEAPTPAQDLQAARAMESALRAANAGEAEWKKMRGIYGDLVKKHPHDLPIRGAFGDFLWNSGDRDAAVGQWRAAEKIDPRNATVLDQLGDALLALGDPKSSLAYYLRAAESQPANASIHFSIANVSFIFRHDLGREEPDAFRLALSHFAEAHRLAPANADYARAYAETYYAAPEPDWAKALQIWEDYLAIAPDKNFALLNVARVQMKLGKSDSARTTLQRVQGAGYERQKLRLIERIETESSPAQSRTPPVPAPKKSPKPGVDEPPGVP